ncbi:MAG: hypothetical protein ABSC19_13360 [Syntrophorhabdales bacterium]|jgi:hypothetical protein
MKALVTQVLAVVITAGLISAAAAQTNPPDARAHADTKEYSAKAAPQADSSVLDDEWGRNMPAYGWIHNYVVRKKAEAARKKSEAAAQPSSPALNGE